ncbi:gliding motility-associated C-terminal domain-containing protein [Catalinimonas sp. 4WD22]|uniref:gliding motility-associated C-terminal domain-containing protein n=1 Tax=Catalinimonas locisalis TaxID=3133978 RepID=UPI003101A2ED
MRCNWAKSYRQYIDMVFLRVIMCPRVFIIICLTAFWVSPGSAQQEANHWFLSPGGYLDFNQKPLQPKIYPYNWTNNGQFQASISDSLGNLLFYTYGRTFYNSQQEVMENGAGSYYGEGGRSTQTSYIIPKPGSDHLYYNFITEFGLTNPELSNNDWTVHYSLVDVTANNGKGTVIFKNRVLTDGMSDALAIYEASDGKSYWLITLGGFGAAALYAYQITSEGISDIPAITPLIRDSGGGHFHIKASPDNRYLVMGRDMYDSSYLELYHFDNETGLFNLRYELIKRDDRQEENSYPYVRYVFTYFYEFSPDSKNLYVIEDSIVNTSAQNITNYASLVRYDLRAPNQQLFEDSRTKIYDYPATNSGIIGRLQLSPDGKIVIGTDKEFLSVINQPNSCNDPDFVYKAITFSEWPGILPTFPAFFFRQENDIWPEVEDEEIIACPGTPVKLSALPVSSAFTYEWTNTKTSQKFQGAGPTFTLPNTPNLAPDTTTYLLKITNQYGCSEYDSMKLIVLPAYALTIRGSKSVCPGVQEVAYWVEDIHSSDLQWSVEGGEIIAGQGTDSIFVNWGESNLDAKVKLLSVNSYGCEDIVPDFSVKIFKQLDTETPNGPDTLDCDSPYHIYSILPTNGSVYEWQIINGEIIEGQGSEQVKVAWHEESPYGKLWIEESVNTELEICFGRSDTLTIVNPRAFGSSNVELLSISAVPQAAEAIQFNYLINHQAFFEEDFKLLRREAGEVQAAWEEVAPLNSEETQITILEASVGQLIYAYKIQGYNICGEAVESKVHHNIVLSAAIHEGEKQIELSWNSYVGWDEGVKTYELYRKLDESENFELQGSSQHLKELLNTLNDGFDHCFYVKAISNTSEYTSSSNEVCLSYDHPIFIPNVITPNGDGKNDFFVISNLELYHQNELQIFDRNGRLVYRKLQYANDWNAIGLPEAVYFYYFTTLKNKKSLKGWVHVIE